MKKRCNCNIKRFINNIKKKLISDGNRDIEEIIFQALLPYISKKDSKIRESKGSYAYVQSFIRIIIPVAPLKFDEENKAFG
jgi:hypothetical protein